MPSATCELKRPVSRVWQPKATGTWVRPDASDEKVTTSSTTASKRKAETEFQRLCVGNTYTCTIHAINGAVVKLGKLSKVQKVYRGLSNRTLSRELKMPDEYGVRGGVEFAFMSCTPIREVALQVRTVP